MEGPVTIDFETTDKDSKKAHAVEFGMHGRGFDIVELIKPPIPIPVETSAVHHICDADVEHSRSWPEVKADIRKLVDSLDRKVLIAHNAGYEIDVLGAGFEDVEWVCTYKCALRLLPDAPNHKNETLRYLLNLPGIGRSAGQMTHSALHDCHVTYGIFLWMLSQTTLHQMIQWTKEHKAFKKIPFGKHAGATWDMIPGDYLTWVCKQADMDPDIKACASGELNKRRSYATAKSNQAAR